MLIASIIFFVLAAIFGLTLLTYVLQNKPTPKAIVLIHGPLAVTGVVLLLIYAYYHAAPWLSIILFLLAATGGLVLFLRDITGKTVPGWMALGHGTLAVIALITLIVFYVGTHG